MRTKALGNVRHFLRHLKPFKGWFAWEIQVGPWVIMWYRGDRRPKPTRDTRLVKGRLHIWYDKLWWV